MHSSNNKHNTYKTPEKQKNIFTRKRALNQKKSKILLMKKNKEKWIISDNKKNIDNIKKTKIILQQYNICGKIEHNIWTCTIKIK